MSSARFTVDSTCADARLGRFKTAHGEFDTPNFMPIGTRGSVKGVDTERLREIGSQIILVNTYHLWQRPDVDVVQALGGIHSFTGWGGPILSDSGGFQVFSLKGQRKLSEAGVTFSSHIDGKTCELTPERAVEIQEGLGVDIAMVLDECPPGDISRKDAESSWGRTLRWAARCLEARTRSDMALFGITQGGMHAELRSRAAEELTRLPFDGFAIGGLSVGETKEAMYGVLQYHPKQLPAESIRYLMGVGTPADILEAVANGVDLFDCVIPTRSGRFGRAYINTDEVWINIRNSSFRTAQEPLDLECGCIACRNYSRGYLHHLFRVGEMLGPQLLSVHNLSHYLDWMARIRVAIGSGHFGEFYREQKLRFSINPEEE